MKLFKQNTADSIMVFIASAADHSTGLTGASSSMSFYLSKNGGAFSSISPTITERGYGWYKIEFTSGNMDTLGDFVIHATVTNGDPIDIQSIVSPTYFITLLGDIAGSVWEESISSHSGVSGSTAEALAAAGGSGDPWNTSLPGAYASGKAGYIIGNMLDSAVSSRLAPTVGGRTLDVSATGEAGIDWANIGGPTTSQNLSGTTISTSQAVASVSGAVGSVTGNVGGNVTGSVGSVATGGIASGSFAAGAINAAAIAADAIGASELATDAVTEIVNGVWNEARSGHVTSGTFGEGVSSVQGNVTGSVASVAGAVGSVTGNVGGNVTGSIGSVASGGIASSSFAAGAINAAAIAADAIGASELAADAVAEIADAIWDEARSGHVSAGTFGEGVASVQGNVTGSVASVAGAVGSVTGNVGGNVTGSIGSLATQAKADVNAECDTALSDYGALKPTTAGRTLDVSLTGEAGVDWSNIGSPTTVVNLSGTTVKTATDVEADTQDIQNRLPAALVSGRMDSSVGAMAANTLTASALASDAVSEIQSGLSTLDAAGVRTAVGLASANLDTQLGAIDDYVDTEVAAIKTVTDKIDTALELDGAVYRFTTNALEQAPTGGSAPTAAAIADAVWEEAIADHSGTVGSTAEALNAAGGSGDPWNTTLPGAYAAGKAGYILGTNLDALVSSRLAPTVAARTLDVSATGEAGVDWANVGSPSTVVNLSGTTVKTATDVETDTQDIQSRLPAALVSGRMDSNMQAAGTDVITSTVLATSAVTEIQTGLSTLDAAGIRTAVGMASANLDTQLSGISTKTTNLPASPAAVGSAMTLAANSIDSGTITAAAANKVSDHVLRRNTSNVEASSDGDSLEFKSVYGATAVQTHDKDASSGTSLEIKKSDDVTTLVSLTLTTDAAADPITKVNNP